MFRVSPIPQNAVVYDPLYGMYTFIDANMLRIGFVGISKFGRIIHENVKVTVLANNTSGRTTKVSSIGFIVLKKITVPANSTLVVYSEAVEVFRYANTGATAVEIDLENEYGARIYGSSIDFEIVLASAVTTNTDYDVLIKGIEIPRVIEPIR